MYPATHLIYYSVHKPGLPKTCAYATEQWNMLLQGWIERLILYCSSGKGESVY